MTEVVGDLVTALDVRDVTDVRHALGAGALRVARQIDAAGPSAPLMRELRVTLQALAKAPGRPDAEPDFVDVLRAKRALRRAAAGLPVDHEFAGIIEGFGRSEPVTGN